MNIDVREYLRVNPISTHELTLSGDGKDCFLLFPESGEGYEVCTQDVLFKFMVKSIFQNLVDDNGFWIVDDNGQISLQDVPLTDNQFTNYVRKSTWDVDRRQIEGDLLGVESQISNKLDALNGIARLDYAGAVDIQSSLTKVLPNGKFHIYDEFDCRTGEIWCWDGLTMQDEGVDWVEIEQPLAHNHVKTRAEAMTSSFASPRGGELIGKFAAGIHQMVSQDTTNGVHAGQNLGAENHAMAIGDSLTYPLYGQNVIDFRDRRRTHDNVPPSTNVHVRCCKFSRTGRNAK
jgi:hypothetical protein